MQATLFFALCILILNVLFVQTRYTDQRQSDVELDTTNEQNAKQLSFEQYLKLLISLQNQQANNDDNVNNSDELSSSSTDDDHDKPLSKRGFFLFPDRRSTKRQNRPIYTYGKKSHWDTFFG
ncbi:unnamed protein product [Adineta steineri]|uniref:Uncharacterized protein n=1 Tax=Adineta steineri TaxID=433720 RepID=A0A814W887_9BILA|nr:unnamed protein product [Adineta steineri]CAF3827343.1 unnamed protein product [Adineta steineri]